MPKYKHILVAIDLAPGSDQVVKEASDMARLFGAKLSLVHVIEPLPGYGYAFIAANEVEQELMKEASKEMKKIGEKYQTPLAAQHALMGPAKAEILDLAEREKADLIMLGSHGESGIFALLGSTANAIIHGAKCDVLTVRVHTHENK